MESCVPTADDHGRLLILVKQCGDKSTTNFNRIFERLLRIETFAS